MIKIAARFSSLLLMCLALGALAGCGTFTIKPGADAAVVYAEYSSEEALEVFDNYLQFERNHEAELLKLSPEFHKVAEELRAHGNDWITGLQRATRNYKAQRTPENLSKLNFAKSLIDEAVAQARVYMANPKTAPAPTPEFSPLPAPAP